MQLVEDPVKRPVGSPVEAMWDWNRLGFPQLHPCPPNTASQILEDTFPKGFLLLGRSLHRSTGPTTTTI
jgi:hypothetical protein